MIRSDILHLGSDPSELENPASFADTQAAKQSLSSSVMVSIYLAQYKRTHSYETPTPGSGTSWKTSQLLRQMTFSRISWFRTYPGFQINREPIWHIDHFEALFDLFIKLHFPQVFTLASLKVKKKTKKNTHNTISLRDSFHEVSAVIHFMDIYFFTDIRTIYVTCSG